MIYIFATVFSLLICFCFDQDNDEFDILHESYLFD